MNVREQLLLYRHLVKQNSRKRIEDVFSDSSYNGLFVGQVVTMFGDVIRSIDPIDYECECTYFDMFDLGGDTIMGTKDGKGYYRAKIGGVWY